MTEVVGASAYLTFSAICERDRLQPEVLIRWVNRINWRHGLEKVAELSARLTWSPTDVHQAMLTVLRPALHQRRLPTDRLDELLAQHPDWALVTEQGLLSLAAMFVMYGSDTGAPLSDPDCSVLLAAVHDYVDDWQVDHDGTLTTAERLLCVVARALRFNQHPMVKAEIARAAVLLATPPKRQKQLAADWERFCLQAFGTDARSYVVFGAAALAHIVTTRGGIQVAPRLNLSDLPTVGFSRAVVESSSINRAELAAELKKDTVQGIPASTPAFFRKPFVRVDGDVVVSVSPPLVQGALHLGLWARCLDAAKQLYGKEGWSTWGAAFGDMFEDWCLRVLRFAQDEGLRDEVLESQHDGIEIADIVLRNRRVVALISIKAKTMPEKDVKGGRAAAELVKWYDQFLFAPESTGRRGAVVQLHKAVERIRRSEVPFIDKDAEIVPMCISFDEIGESVLFYQWLDPRCRTEGLLQQDGVHPLTVSSVRGFEHLLAVGAQRGSAVTPVRDKVRSQKWRSAELARFLLTKKDCRQPLRAITKLYDEVSEEMLVQLFGDAARDELARQTRRKR